jgi:hypothetical protein
MRYSLPTSVFLLFLCCFAAIQTLCGQIAAHQLSSPRIGVVRYADGSLYLLYGLPGSYLIGPRVLDGTDAASFSKQGGIVSRKGTLALLRADLSTAQTFEATGETSPILGINDDLTTAIAWLPSVQKLVHWNGQSFASVSVPDLLREGEVSFVSKSDNRTASLLLHSPDGSVNEASVSLGTGQLVSVMPITGAHGRAFRQGSFVLFSDNRNLTITTPSNGNTKQIPISGGNLKMERISSDCLHVRSLTSQRDWVLHFHNGDFDLEELPPPPSSDLSSAVPVSEVVR